MSCRSALAGLVLFVEVLLPAKRDVIRFGAAMLFGDTTRATQWMAFCFSISGKAKRLIRCFPPSPFGRLRRPSNALAADFTLALDCGVNNLLIVVAVVIRPDQSDGLLALGAHVNRRNKVDGLMRLHVLQRELGVYV